MKEELFDDLILERGYEYAQEGAVDHVRKVGEVIYATVHGTEDYHVKMDNNDMFCDCPYAKEGAHCKHMAAVMYYLDSHPVYDEHVLIDALSEKQAKQLLKSILKDHPEYFDQLPKVEKKEEIKESVEESFRNHPDIKSARGYIVKCIDEYYDIDVIIHTFKDYLEDKVVFQSLIDYYGSLDIKKAISFVKSLNTDKPSIKKMYQSCLKDLYLKDNNRDSYLDILWTLVREDGQIDFYRELKRQYSKKEWEPLRDELLKNLPPRARLDKIYLEEGMYDNLLDLVIQTPGLYILEEYYHDLLDYPEQLLNKYLEELKPLVGKKDITHYLKEIEEIPGGIQFISVNKLRK
ncbi:SWIM zinc finger family protein [uncultured Catenibacterium sp.]|uniref:SWIM zinc finger family protein n=1 Tax=uncultured Catenibacterium sp. TaxID=286142 RepID=UPI0025DCDC53|nr:SWIM zinc finger family protein [uncultured Catenibacterium sp.]